MSNIRARATIDAQWRGGNETREAGRDVKGIGESARETSKGFDSMSVATGAAGVAFAALAGAGVIVAQGFKKLVELGSDAGEEMSKFGVVFEGVTGGADTATATFDSLAESLGRNKFELRAAGSAFGDLFQPLGFAADAALGLSEQMTGLAADLSSFNNMPMDEALQRLQGTLIGSHENALAFGVVINESVLKQELAAIGAENLTGAMLEQAKVQARINLLMAGTTAAQGDVIRTSDGFANQMRGIQDTVAEAATEIGTKLVPILSNELAPVLDILSSDTIPALVQAAEDFGPAFADAASKVGEASVVVLTNLDKIVRTGRIVTRVLKGIATLGLSEVIPPLWEMARATSAVNTELSRFPGVANFAEDQLGDIDDAANGAMESTSEFAASLPSLDTELNAFVTTTETAIDVTDEYVNKLAESIEGTTRSAQATDRMAESHEQFAPAANAATTSIEEEINALDGLFEGFEKINTSISGGFITALDQTDGKMTTLQSATSDLDGFILNLAASSGATAGEMALLAAATGDYSQAAIDAAVKQIEFEIRLETIRQRFADGSISVHQMRDAVQDLVNTMNGLQDKTVNVTVNTTHNGQQVNNSQTTNGSGLQEFGDGELPPGRAIGGFVGANQSVMVGENGPEMFTPVNAGFIRDNETAFGGQNQNNGPRTVNHNTFVGLEATALFAASLEQDAELQTVVG